MGVGYAHRATLNAHDLVRLIAQLKNIAGHTFDGEIFVDRAYHDGFRFQHDVIIGVVGYGAAGRHRAERRAAPAVQHVVHRVAMDVGVAATARCRITVGQHAHDFQEFSMAQIAVGIGATEQRKQFVFVPILQRDFGGDLLREHVERFLGNDQMIEFFAPNCIQQRSTFDQIVAGLRKQTPLGQRADGVAGASHALQKRRDGVRRTELTHQIHIADVDAQLQRSGRNQRLQFAALQALLGVQPLFLRHAAVVRGHGLFTEPLR